MTGQFYECDQCHVRDFSGQPPVGWIAISRITDAGEGQVAVEESHLCSTACLIMQVTPQASQKVH